MLDGLLSVSCGISRPMNRMLTSCMIAHIASSSKSRLGFVWATVGPWDLHGLGLAHSNPTGAPPGPAHSWPMLRPIGPCPLRPMLIPRWDWRGLEWLPQTWAPHGLAIWAPSSRHLHESVCRSHACLRESRVLSVHSYVGRYGCVRPAGIPFSQFHEWKGYTKN